MMNVTGLCSVEQRIRWASGNVRFRVGRWRQIWSCAGRSTGCPTNAPLLLEVHNSSLFHSSTESHNLLGSNGPRGHTRQENETKGTTARKTAHQCIRGGKGCTDRTEVGVAWDGGLSAPLPLSGKQNLGKGTACGGEEYGGEGLGKRRGGCLGIAGCCCCCCCCCCSLLAAATGAGVGFSVAKVFGGEVRAPNGSSSRPLPWPVEL